MAIIESFQTIKNNSVKENLVRKSSFVDEVKLYQGKPLFSWIEINPTELCNRKCSFCPRVDDDLYPNQNLNMSINLAEKIATELLEIKYEGGVVFAGYGEPMLTKDFFKIVESFNKLKCKLEIVTNGDKLNSDNIKELYRLGITCIVVSMYDGPEQIKHFHKIFENAGITNDKYILRDRWHSATDEFGLKLTNRAGLVTIGNQASIEINKRCLYPSYSMMLDWNGDVYLCPQDWQKKIKFGNLINEKIIDVWNSSRLNRTRMNLLEGHRQQSPCKDCNADGCLHGFNHAEVWSQISG